MKINQISLDESGEHMGVCSEDGKVWGLHGHVESSAPALWAVMLPAPRARSSAVPTIPAVGEP